MKLPLSDFLAPYGRRTGTVRTHRDGPVLRVELDRPEEGNAVNETMLDDLLGVLAVPDPEVRVLVLGGAGPDFSLGGDRNEFGDWLDEDPTGRGIRIAADKARRVCDALSSHPAVTVARVQGKVIGSRPRARPRLRPAGRRGHHDLPPPRAGPRPAHRLGRCAPQTDQRDRRRPRP